MAKTMTAIILEFNQVCAQAQKITECSKTLSTINTKMKNMMGSLNQEWQGEASNEYIRKCDTLAEMIKGTSADLLAAANAILRAATLYKEAEEKAMTLAKTRTYSGS